MRLLLDLCIPRRFKNELAGFDVSTTHEMGWGDMDDGPLLEQMSGHFDIFITVDKGIATQQRLDHRPFATIILHAKSNRLDDLQPLTSSLKALIRSAKSGELHELSSPDQP